MASRFDGLRSVLGNGAVAIPEAEAPAVGHGPVAAVAEAPVEKRLSAAAPDLPDLSDLDRGLYPADDVVTSSHDSRSARIDDDLSVDEAVFTALPGSPAASKAPARAASSPVRSVPMRREQDGSHQRVSGWTAVAVMVLGLFLGGTAAIAVFRDHVSHIIASLQ
jgi:hypothetical protein